MVRRRMRVLLRVHVTSAAGRFMLLVRFEFDVTCPCTINNSTTITIVSHAACMMSARRMLVTRVTRPPKGVYHRVIIVFAMYSVTSSMRMISLRLQWLGGTIVARSGPAAVGQVPTGRFVAFVRVIRLGVGRCKTQKTRLIGRISYL